MAAPSSSTAIANLALGLLKVSQVVSIDPPDANSEGAKIMARIYDQCRQAVLEDHPWAFARRRVNVPAESDAPAFEYSYKYQLPTDYLRLVRAGEVWYDQETDYEIEGDYILIDEAGPLQLVYIFDQTDVSKFSAKFIDLLSIRLASQAAYELTGSATLAKGLKDEYKDALTSAASVAGQNRPTRRIQKSKFGAARQNLGRRYNYIAE